MNIKDYNLNTVCTQKNKIYSGVNSLSNRGLAISSFFYNIFIRFYLYSPKGFSVKKSVCQSDFDFSGCLGIWTKSFYNFHQSNFGIMEVRHELF